MIFKKCTVLVETADLDGRQAAVSGSADAAVSSCSSQAGNQLAHGLFCSLSYSLWNACAGAFLQSDDHVTVICLKK